MSRRKFDTGKLVLGAVFTALVIILQLLATFTAFFGPFSSAVALIPIAMGAIICGPAVGAWLGFVFGVVVLASGGAILFWTFDIPGTIITVLAKGTLCGYVSGLVYKFVKRFNTTIATIAASVICPIVNTGVFLLGCAVFFMDDVVGIAAAAGSAEAGYWVFIGFAFANFLLELGMNTLLSPVIIRVMNIKNNLLK